MVRWGPPIYGPQPPKYQRPERVTVAAISAGLGAGKTPAEIALAAGVTKQAVSARIKSHPGLSRKWGEIRRKRSARAAAKSDAKARRVQKRLALKCVVIEARRRGMTWAAICDALCVENFKSLQFHTR